MIRNRATPEGRELGAQLAKWCDDAEPKARLRMPELPPRCNSCAFRAGPHVANGSPHTQMDALKCAIEGREFYCHEPARSEHLCAGWAMFVLAADSAADFGQVPWPLSTETANGQPNAKRKTPMSDDNAKQPERTATAEDLARVLTAPEWPPRPNYDAYRVLVAANSHLLGSLIATLIDGGALDAPQIEAMFEGALRQHRGEHANALDGQARVHLAQMRAGLLSRFPPPSQTSEH